MPAAAATVAPPRPARRASPLPPAERRDAIVTAVLPLVVARGASVTSKELAAAAGVSEGTIFKVFGDKDGLLAAVMQRATDPTVIEEEIAAIDRSRDFEDQLATAVALVQTRLVDVWSLLSGIGPIGLDEAPRRLEDSPATTALFAEHRSQIRVAPAVAARQFRSLILAFSHPVLDEAPPDPHEFVEFFLHGVGAPASGGHR
jgi:AcrR family transcriptional regulator